MIPIAQNNILPRVLYRTKTTALNFPFKCLFPNQSLDIPDLPADDTAIAGCFC